MTNTELVETLRIASKQYKDDISLSMLLALAADKIENIIIDLDDEVYQ
jgi:hypothetical protein